MHLIITRKTPEQTKSVNIKDISEQEGVKLVERMLLLPEHEHQSATVSEPEIETKPNKMKTPQSFGRLKKPDPTPLKLDPELKEQERKAEQNAAHHKRRAAVQEADARTKEEEPAWHSRSRRVDYTQNRGTFSIEEALTEETPPPKGADTRAYDDMIICKTRTVCPSYNCQGRETSAKFLPLPFWFVRCPRCNTALRKRPATEETQTWGKHHLPVAGKYGELFIADQEVAEDEIMERSGKG